MSIRNYRESTIHYYAWTEKVGSQRIQTIASRNEWVLKISGKCLYRSNDVLYTGNQIFIHSRVVRVMLNAKSSISSIVLHSPSMSCGSGVKTFENLYKRQFETIYFFQVCIEFFVFQFYLLWLHDKTRLWPILTMVRGKVWNYLVIFIIGILNSPNTNKSWFHVLAPTFSHIFNTLTRFFSSKIPYNVSSQ